MRLTVLGSSGTYPAPGKACSGYLVAEGDTRLLLDCGSGVLANLQAHMALEDLTAIFITHMHADHFLDLVPLRYALVYGRRSRTKPLPVHLPPGGRQTLEQVVAPLTEPGNSFLAPFDLSEYREGVRYGLGGFGVRLAPLKHFVPSYGIEVRGSGRVVYSGDAGPCPELVAPARGADLFLCEATWLEDRTPALSRGHLTAKEVGEIAGEAGVRHLLLTHISPDVDPQRSLEMARAACGGKVLLAQEGQSYLVDSR